MRGDLAIGLGVLVVAILAGAFSFFVLGIVVNVVWAFVYNKFYTRKLIERGYKIDQENAAAAKAALGMTA